MQGRGIAAGVLVLVSAFGLVLIAPRARAGTERELPPKYSKSPYSLMSLSVGHPNDGWQVRAKKLKKTPHLRIKDGSENKVYGHPALVLMLKRTSREIFRASRGAVMLVGDLSTKDGGPLAGHHSHQSGRDADVAFYARDSKGRLVALDRFVAFDANGKAKDGSGLVFDDATNWLLLQAWLRDDRAGISHVFVSSPLKKRMLDFARSQKRFRKYVDDAARLCKQPENAEPHDDHFHVRISCPKKIDDICREQSAQ